MFQRGTKKYGRFVPWINEIDSSFHILITSFFRTDGKALTSVGVLLYNEIIS